MTSNQQEKIGQKIRWKSGVIVWMLNKENASNRSYLSMLYVDQGHSFIFYVVFYDMSIAILIYAFL